MPRINRRKILGVGLASMAIPGATILNLGCTPDQGNRAGNADGPPDDEPTVPNKDADKDQRSGEPYHLVKTMEQRTDGSWSEPVLHADASAFIGKHLVIAVRYPQAGKQALVHFYGPITRITEQDGIVISRSDDRGDFAIPPRAFLVDEHQRETRPTSMTEVIRPDYATLIDLDGPPREHGWDRALDRSNAQ